MHVSIYAYIVIITSFDFWDFFLFSYRFFRRFSTVISVTISIVSSWYHVVVVVEICVHGPRRSKSNSH